MLASNMSMCQWNRKPGRVVKGQLWNEYFNYCSLFNGWYSMRYLIIFKWENNKLCHQSLRLGRWEELKHMQPGSLPTRMVDLSDSGYRCWIVAIFEFYTIIKFGLKNKCYLCLLYLTLYDQNELVNFKVSWWDTHPHLSDCFMMLCLPMLVVIADGL